MRSVVAGLAAMLLLVVPIAPFATPAAAQAQAQAEAVQPGSPLVDEQGDAFCTLSYVFDDEAREEVYIATAAHCVEAGERVRTAGHGSFGTVVFRGEGSSEDYALIRVDEAARPAVDAQVRGLALTAPTGVAQPEDTRAGDLIWTSGWGIATAEVEPARENRPGVLTEHRDEGIQGLMPAHPGDSGGPWTHASGLALSIVSRITLGAGVTEDQVTVPVVEERVDVPMPRVLVAHQGPTIAGLLAHAEQAGFDLTLRTAG